MHAVAGESGLELLVGGKRDSARIGHGDGG